MAVLKCKMCGGELNIQDGMTVAECEYCGCKQTLPKLVSDNIANLYDRANHFRRNNDFDKAEGIYERILAETPDDSEAYWSLVLCRYGIEYVEDPATRKRVPTVNRTQYTSIFDDENYKSAIEHADAIQRRVYEEEAAAINEIQKGILAISQKEEPFDVFICYKETDKNGRRTPDSVLATDLYHQLINEGFKVFFARITLEDKLGTAYEPYIFAALNSAKVMVVLGTKPEYFNAVWVKNEWSRYLALVNKSGGKKVLIPAYRDMDPYDLPEEFSHLQAQDMSKLGFMQDLIRGIKKITKADEPKAAVKETVVVGSTNVNIAPLLKRAFMFLEDGEWDKADDFCEQVLNQDPENAEAYVGKLMADLKVRRRGDLKDQPRTFDYNRNYQKAIRFADKKTSDELTGYITFITTRNNNEIYNNAVSVMKAAKTEKDFKGASEIFKTIPGWRDADKLAAECAEKAEVARKDAIYNKASGAMKSAKTEGSYIEASEIFKTIPGWMDADILAEKCKEKAEECRKEAVLENAKVFMKKDTLESYSYIVFELKKISGYKNADELIAICETRISELTAKKEEEDKRAKKKKRRTINIVTIISSVIAVLIVFLIVLNTVIIPNVKINATISEAKELAKQKKYSSAITKLDELSDNQEAKILKTEYQILEAKDLAAEKKYPAASACLLRAGLNEETTELYRDWSRKASSIAANYYHTVGLKADGTVVATEYTGTPVIEDYYGHISYKNFYYGWCDVYSWKDIVAVSAGKMHTVGLKSDGTVVATKYTGDQNNYYGWSDVSGWKDIVSVSAGSFHTVGLKADGTVVAVGETQYGRCNVDDWKDIVAVSAGGSHTVGLKADGTVVAVGDNDEGQCDVRGWTDIVAVSAGGIHTVGLKADGTVVAVGDNEYGQCDVQGWKDIVAVSAGAYNTVGLKADGTVVAVGDNDKYQCNVKSWTDIVAVSAGWYHTVGLKADGTVVAVGDNEYGQRDVSDWKLW